MVGQEDVLTPVELSEDLNRNIKGSELAIIPKAGHLANLEQPFEFNKTLTEFLQKLAGRG